MASKPDKKRNAGGKHRETVLPPALKHSLALLAIIFTAIICYSNTFSVPFVLDDITSILTNPLVKEFDLRLKSRITGDLSFALNYLLGGGEPAGYHLVNLLLHLSNAALIYLLVQVLFRTPAMACQDGGNFSNEPDMPIIIGFGAALIFATHPLQTQAVTYIAQRVALLAAFFYLAAILCYAFSRLKSGRPAAYLLLALSLVFSILGVLSKENAATISLSILLLELLFFRGPLSRRLLAALWYLLPLFVLPFLLLWHTGISGDLLGDVGRLTAEGGAPPRLAYLLTQFPVIVSYLRLFFIPMGQNLDHDVLLRTDLTDPVVMASLVFLGGIVAGTLWCWKLSLRSGSDTRFTTLALFGIGWFFIAMLLESGLIPLRDVMFEHRIYLPSAGLTIAVVALAWVVASRFKKAEVRSPAAPFLYGLLVIGVLLATATFMRNRVWESEITLWEDAVAKSPAKARTHGSLGHAYQRSGRLDEAVSSYREAVALAPADHIARNNLGTLYLMRKLPAEALEQFREALRSQPGSVSISYNLGLAYSDLGRLGDAESAYRKVVALDNKNDRAFNNLGIVLSRQGRNSEARAAFRAAVAANPKNEAAAKNLRAIGE